MILVKDSNVTAKWLVEENRWDIRDLPIYAWATNKNKLVTTYFGTLEEALAWIIAYDQSKQNG